MDNAVTMNPQKTLPNQVTDAIVEPRELVHLPKHVLVDIKRKCIALLLSVDEALGEPPSIETRSQRRARG